MMMMTFTVRAKMMNGKTLRYKKDAQEERNTTGYKEQEIELHVTHQPSQSLPLP
jgi:hypothetical protein